MTLKHSTLLYRFERLQLSAPDFHHADHVRVAFEILDKYDFIEACSRYARTIKRMADAVGVPEKYNATITFAFMSLISEHKAHSDAADAESFLAANPDLLCKDILSDWYSKDRMTSALARAQFLLPDKPIRGAFA